MVDPEDIFVGVAMQSVNLLVRPTEGKGQMYWGYICCAAKIFSPLDKQLVNYGELCTKNDSVGVLLEFDADKAQLTFYRNKKCLGLAFAEMPCSTYYPAATLYYSGVKVSLNASVSVPVKSDLSGHNH